MHKIFKIDLRLTAYKEQSRQLHRGVVAARHRPNLHVVRREDLRSGGSYEHAEW